MKGERLKIWAGILASVVALGTAMFAAIKPESEEKATKTYEELSTKMEEMSKSHALLHDDVTRMQEYLKAHAEIRKLEIELAKAEAREERARDMARGDVLDERTKKHQLVPKIPEMKSSVPKEYDAPPIDSL